MGKQVELLKHHADFPADQLDVLQIAGQLVAVDDDFSFLMLLEPIDAADQGGLAGSRGTANDDTLAGVDGQVDVLEHVELTVPLVDADQFDRDVFADDHFFRRLPDFVLRDGIGHFCLLVFLFDRTLAPSGASGRYEASAPNTVNTATC